MIDARRAVQIAKTKSEEVLDWAAPKLEEIERELYQGHDSWSVTLSTPRPSGSWSMQKPANCWR